MGSGFTGPRDTHLGNSGAGQRPAVHRSGDRADPSLAGLRERYGDRWDLLTADNGSLLAVPRSREDGVSRQIVVSAWELAGFGDRLAEADRAIKEST